MLSIPDDFLMDSYKKAIALNLCPQFITLLENEIAGRYYYSYGKVKKSYQNDPEVAKALDLLNHPQQYNELLSAKK